MVKKVKGLLVLAFVFVLAACNSVDSVLPLSLLPEGETYEKSTAGKPAVLEVLEDNQWEVTSKHNVYLYEVQSLEYQAGAYTVVKIVTDSMLSGEKPTYSIFGDDSYSEYHIIKETGDGFSTLKIGTIVAKYEATDGEDNPSNIEYEGQSLASWEEFIAGYEEASDKEGFLKTIYGDGALQTVFEFTKVEK